jgi:16S rRNA (cytosine1402-N4)-methyltransferase
MSANPRARSAKLRYGVRTKAVPCGLDDRLMALAKLPEVHPGGR